MRTFRPTFVVTVTPSEVAHGDTAKGQPYSSLKNATISREGRENVVRTVMAFGPTASEIASRLEPGKPVRLAVQHDDGTLRIIGLPRDVAA